MGNDDVDWPEGVAVGGDVDAPENEKRGDTGFELSDVEVEVDTGGTGASTARVDPKVTGTDEELAEAPNMGA